MDHNVEIIGRDGKRRRMRPGEQIADGEVVSFKMEFMDQQMRDHLTAKFPAVVHVTDSCGERAGHRPGYLFDRALDRMEDAAATAYELKRERLSSAWRTKDENHDPLDQHPDRDRAVADAYEQKRRRLADAWRH